MSSLIVLLNEFDELMTIFSSYYSNIVFANINFWFIEETIIFIILSFQIFIFKIIYKKKHLNEGDFV